MAKAARAATPAKSEEYEKAKLASKDVFFFKDPEFGVDQKSREVFKNQDKEVHYPTPYRGSSKYTNITKFTYLGFRGKLPKGVYKVHTYGYGFTKRLWPLIDYLNSQSIHEVLMEKGQTDRLDLTGGILYLSEATLTILHDTFANLSSRHKAENEAELLHLLHGVFPQQIAAPRDRYVPGSIATSLHGWSNAVADFNDLDKQAIKDLFDKLTLLPDFFAAVNMEKTREILDNQFIEAALKEFADLRARTTDTESLEKQWQAFLKKHNWIFSTLFAQPVILHQDEAYVGGKTLDNRNGKYNDFLIKSGLTGNVSFVEIKTHLTPVMDGRPYRGTDVFAASKDLTGCIGQVLNQRDNFQKEFYTITRRATETETFNSKALVIVGSVADLSAEQKSAFELFRSNSRDVEILTFDELEFKIKSLLQITTGQAISKSAAAKKAAPKKAGRLKKAARKKAPRPPSP